MGTTTEEKYWAVRPDAGWLAKPVGESLVLGIPILLVVVMDSLMPGFWPWALTLVLAASLVCLLHSTRRRWMVWHAGLVPFKTRTQMVNTQKTYLDLMDSDLASLAPEFWRVASGASMNSVPAVFNVLVSEAREAARLNRASSDSYDTDARYLTEILRDAQKRSL